MPASAKSRQVTLIGIVEILLGVPCLPAGASICLSSLFVILMALLGIRGLGPYPSLTEQEQTASLLTGLAALMAGAAIFVLGVLQFRAGLAVLARRRPGLTWTLRLVVIRCVAFVLAFILLVCLTDAESTPWHLLPWDQSDREVALMLGLPIILMIGAYHAWIWRVLHNERLAAEFDPPAFSGEKGHQPEA